MAGQVKRKQQVSPQRTRRYAEKSMSTPRYSFLCDPPRPLRLKQISFRLQAKPATRDTCGTGIPEDRHHRWSLIEINHFVFCPLPVLLSPGAAIAVATLSAAPRTLSTLPPRILRMDSWSYPRLSSS